MFVEGRGFSAVLFFFCVCVCFFLEGGYLQCGFGFFACVCVCVRFLCFVFVLFFVLCFVFNCLCVVEGVVFLRVRIWIVFGFCFLVLLSDRRGGVSVFRCFFVLVGLGVVIEGRLGFGSGL